MTAGLATIKILYPLTQAKAYGHLPLAMPTVVAVHT